jgi:hypothetical protein
MKETCSTNGAFVKRIQNCYRAISTHGTTGSEYFPRGLIVESLNHQMRNTVE